MVELQKSGSFKKNAKFYFLKIFFIKKQQHAFKENYLMYQSFQTLIKVYFQISLISFWTFYIFMDYSREYVIDSIILAILTFLSWLCFISVHKKIILIYFKHFFF